MKSKEQDKNLNYEYVMNQFDIMETSDDFQAFFENLEKYLSKADFEIEGIKILPLFREKKAKFKKQQNVKNSRLIEAEFLNLETLILKRINTLESHKEAINILVKKDYSMAQNYCADQSFQKIQTNCSNPKNFYLLNYLLEIYVKTYNEQKTKENLERVNNLLRKYSGNPNLNSSKVTDMLPEEFLVNDSGFDFFEFLEKTITELEAKDKFLKFKNQISQAELNKMNYELGMYKKRWVQINEDSECAKCRDKIKNKLFYVYPNGIVVDCNCITDNKKKNICPVTFQDFEKSNLL